MYGSVHMDEMILSVNTILTDVLQAGPFQRCTAPQVEMDHKRTIVLQNLLHCAVCYPVFFHREVDLTETQ